MKYALQDGEGRTIAIAEAVSGATRTDIETFARRRVAGYAKIGDADVAEREHEAQLKRLTETFRGLGMGDPERAARGRDGGQLPLVRVSPQLSDAQLRERATQAREYATSLQESDKRLNEALVRAGFIEPRGDR